MRVIGLTGSIAMGKSTVAKQFAALGVAVCDSDRLVHQLLAKKGLAVSAVARHFPESFVQDHIDRKLLGKLVFANPERLKLLETLLHPLVRKAQQEFIKQQRRRGKKIVLLDIPLLFETQAEKRLDDTITVTAPYFLQKQRVLRRSGMTEAKFHAILARQMPDYHKRRKSDYVIPTGLGKRLSLANVNHIIRRLA